MLQICSNRVELLKVLGREGRHAIIQALVSAPGPWSLASLAAAADVHPVVAGRAVRELEALACVDIVRPGRDLQVRFLPQSAAGRFFASLQVPDLGRLAAQTFAQAFTVRARILWTGRVVVLTGDEDAAWDAVGPALDAVRAAGLPLPEVDVFGEEEKIEGDLLR